MIDERWLGGAEPGVRPAASARRCTSSAWARARGLPRVPMRKGAVSAMNRGLRPETERPRRPCGRGRLRHWTRMTPAIAHLAHMIVLGIETSCDETAAAVVRRADGRRGAGRGGAVSQLAEHAPYGGVVPEIAARAHLEHLDALIARGRMAEAGARLRRSRRHRGHRRAGPDRRGDGGADDRQGHRRWRRQAASSPSIISRAMRCRRG